VCEYAATCRSATRAASRASSPVGLAGIIAIGAGKSHSLALKSDGTVVAWGNNDKGQADVPAGLTEVVAIAAGQAHNLALRRNGTVIAGGSMTLGRRLFPTGSTGLQQLLRGGGTALR
jgi:alpha-tubulin suppressor-like RCC1 family protein